jgi:hypothetical protein
MAGGGFISLDHRVIAWSLVLRRWQFPEKRNEIRVLSAILGCSCLLRDCEVLDGKGKATLSGARKYLDGFGFLAIRS